MAESLLAEDIPDRQTILWMVVVGSLGVHPRYTTYEEDPAESRCYLLRMGLVHHEYDPPVRSCPSTSDYGFIDVCCVT